MASEILLGNDGDGIARGTLQGSENIVVYVRLVLILERCLSKGPEL